MLRYITLCTVLLMACFPGAFAQKALPKYIASGYPGNLNAIELVGNGIYWKIQCIYTPQQFAGMPSGPVKSIYMRWANKNPKQIPVPMQKLRIGLRNTSFSAWPKNALIDTFVHIEQYQLDTSLYAFGDSVADGDWIKISLTKNTFYYSPASNFVMEIAYDTPSSVKGRTYLFYTTNPNNMLRRFEGPRDSSRYVNYGTAYSTFDLGIDQAVVGVEGIDNITSFGLFPNPCTDGYFNISFDTKQSMKEVSIKVSDATGRQVYARSYAGTGTSFFKEVDIRGAAKGLYFVKVVADGEVITRRVVME